MVRPTRQPSAKTDVGLCSSSVTATTLTSVPPTRDFFSSEAQKLAKQETASIPADDRLPAIVAGGHVGRTLCAAARPGDLIVVGSRGRGALVETLTGSTGSYCAAHSLVPVVIVPESAHTAEATTHIVVGVDGSANSIAALTWALDHCPAGATIEALHAYVPAAPMFELAETYSDDFEKRAQALLDEAVGVAVAAARQPVATENLVSRIVLEDPRTALTGTDANMIVVGARGHRGVAHLLMGSVATALTHHVETTTVIVPSGG